MKKPRDHFPHDPDYDFGDANHLPVVPVIVEEAPEAEEGEAINDGLRPTQQPKEQS